MDTIPKLNDTRGTYTFVCKSIIVHVCYRSCFCKLGRSEPSISAYRQPKFASEVCSVVSPCPQRRIVILREDSRRCTCPQNNNNANVLGDQVAWE
jgi:hypothetical protein